MIARVAAWRWVAEYRLAEARELAITSGKHLRAAIGSIALAVLTTANWRR